MLHTSFLSLLLASGVVPEGTPLFQFQDGREIHGAIQSADTSGFVLEGVPDPVALHELRSISFLPKEPEAAPVESGPFLLFREGERLGARVKSLDEHSAQVEIPPPRGLPGKALPVTIPLEVLRAFREDATRSEAEAFQADLLRPKPPSGPTGDAVLVRWDTGLLRVEGVLSSLDTDYLTLRMDEKVRRLRRNLVAGVILAPVASTSVETETPAVLDLVGGGQIPGFLVSIDSKDPAAARVLLRFAGSLPQARAEIPLAWVQRIRFSSDRVVFLSSLVPARVEEVPLIGTKPAFPWKKDLSSTGGPIKLGGRSYRRGLGVHARSTLEFDLEAKYRSLAGTVGLDDAAGEASSVSFHVFADDKEIWTKAFAHGEKPENLALPMDGVRRLRLRVDYGADSMDLGDHADWADLRVTR